MARPTPSFVVLALVVAGMLAGPGPAEGRHGRGSQTPPIVYTSPANILRGQHALERLGHLKRGAYAPGQVDPATREALQDFQREHSLRLSNEFDFDTFAMLPIDERPDKDDDGVADADDRCPRTKRGTRVGHDGCPIEGAS